MLPPRSARCVGTARVLYAQILDRIERRGLRRVLRRARVPTWRKAVTAARIMVTGPPRPPDRAELDGSRRSHVTSDAQLRRPCPRRLDGCRERPRIPIPRVPQPRENRMTATWRQAKPARIAAALAVSQAQNSGGWFVAGQAPTSGARSRWPGRSPAARWCSGATPTGELVAGPGACPHLGALMDKCPVLDGTMYCRWHGLAFTQQGDRTWSPYRAYDDGVLIWVGLPTEGETPTERPTLPARPPLAELGHRGDRPARNLRAAGRDRQPARPVARLLVPPVRVQPPGGRRRGLGRAHPGGRRDLPAEPDLGRAGAGRVQLPRRPDHRDAHHRRRGHRERGGDARHPARGWTTRAGR